MEVFSISPEPVRIMFFVALGVLLISSLFPYRRLNIAERHHKIVRIAVSIMVVAVAILYLVYSL